MIFGIVFLIIIVAAIAALLLYKLGPLFMGKQRQRFYRQRFRYLSNLSKSEADDILDRQVSRLREKYPGHRDEWYLEKALYDLERDKL